MKLRSALLVLVCSLILGSSGPVFAADAVPTRADQVTSIQNQYNPLFDAQYVRLLVLKKKALVDANLLRSVKAVVADFLEVRRVIDAGLISSTSDLAALKDYAEEETGEFSSTLDMLEAQAAKIKTISCIKGKAVKKVSGLTPKCPKGYKKK